MVFRNREFDIKKKTRGQKVHFHMIYLDIVEMICKHMIVVHLMVQYWNATEVTPFVVSGS